MSTQAKVINLYGGPGTGKSTTAAGLFCLMKNLGINVEIAREFAKDLVWENSTDTLKDQLFVTATQHHRIFTLKDKVDFIITDSPILLGKVYGKEHHYLINSLYSRYDNIDVFLKRVKPYNTSGRLQSEEKAKQLDSEIKKLTSFNFTTVSDSLAPSKIFEFLKKEKLV